MCRHSQQQSSLCQHCAMSGLCFDEKKVAKLRSHRVYHKSDLLYDSESVFNAIYILRSGSAKSSILTQNGSEQVTGFYYPGDLIGLDGFDTGLHAQRISFLETSSICHIALGELDRAMAQSPSIRYRLLQGMSHALNNEDRFLLNLNNMTSGQRFASFLSELSLRFEKRGLSGSIFDLSMTRADIASYLGMAVETLSRLLTSFQSKGIVEVNRRRINILDRARLERYVADDREVHMLFSRKSRDTKKGLGLSA